jgi:hypothetical protein
MRKGFRMVALPGGRLRQPPALDSAPLTVFCSTRECDHSSGGGMLQRGATPLERGGILAPESSVAHIVERKYIHMLQAQQLGLSGRQQTPPGFTEGMSLLVSQPPADDLPADAVALVAPGPGAAGRVRKCPADGASVAAGGQRFVQAGVASRRRLRVSATGMGTSATVGPDDARQAIRHGRTCAAPMLSFPR